MSTFFVSTPGTVVAFSEPAEQGQIVLPPLVKLEPTLSFTSQRAIITSIGVTQQVSQQFMMCLGGGIYVYVFGDQVGRFVLSGMLVPYTCDGGSDVTHGLERTLEYYNSYKLSKRGKEPCQVTIGNAFTINAFLAGFSANVVDPMAKLVQFTMNFFILPGDAITSSKMSSTTDGRTAVTGGTRRQQPTGLQ